MARTKQTAGRTTCGIALCVQCTRATRSSTRIVRGASVESIVSLSSLTSVPSSLPAQRLNDTLAIMHADRQTLEEGPTNRVCNIHLHHRVDTNRNMISTVIYVMMAASSYFVVSQSPVCTWSVTIA